jgi:hypothetical protein
MDGDAKDAGIVLSSPLGGRTGGAALSLRGPAARRLTNPTFVDVDHDGGRANGDTLGSRFQDAA